MRTEQTLILERTEVKQHAIGKDINLISLEDFNMSFKPFQTYTIILFIDNNGETRILKNRFGDKGVPSIKELFSKLTDNQRLEVMSDYCKHCGCNDNTCRCWDDE
jgi:hypothetical protein